MMASKNKERLNQEEIKARLMFLIGAVLSFVFFDFVDDDKTIINHIGLVIRCSEKQIVTIEGNTSAAGGNQRNGGEVMVKSRALGARSFVVGYGRPTYEPFSGDLPDRPKGEK